MFLIICEEIYGDEGWEEIKDFENAMLIFSDDAVVAIGKTLRGFLVTIDTIYLPEADRQSDQQAAGQHWLIDNKLHWSLDAALREDACRNHRGRASETLARVRYVARNYPRGETRFQCGIR